MAQRNTLKSSLQTLNTWMDRLGLDKTWHLEVEVKSHLDSHSSHAKINWTDRRAMLSLSEKSMAEFSPSRWEQILVHELCHLLIAEIEDWAWKYFGQGQLFDSCRSAQEIVCDRLAILMMRRYKRAPLTKPRK